MTTTGYRHGINTSEQATSILPARTVDSAVVFAVGTAAVHTLAEDKARPVNVPQLFYSYDEAVQARLAAENLIHNGFIQKWKEWNEKEKEDPEWGKEHPLVFDVKKEDGEIRVSV